MKMLGLERFEAATHGHRDYVSLPFILKYGKWAKNPHGHVARMEERRVVCSVLVGRPEGKRPLERPRRRWEDNIKMDLRETWGANWIRLTQDRVQWRAFVSTVMNLRVP
jgi:hypothetical protein